ncbi:MAG: glycine cleavage system aminomethyltransferase GcvT [Polyangiaceae bacterium]
MTAPSPRRTPLFETQRTLGARFVPFAGWELPVQFKGIVAEHHAVRRAAGLFDVSHMGRLQITGKEALSAVDRLVTNSLERTPDHRAVYGCCCNDGGTILDDLICYRESRDRIFVICNASNREKIREHFARELPQSLTLEDVSDETGLLALQGPKAFAVLDGLSSGAIATLPRMAFQRETVAGIEVTCALTGYTGELGVELVCVRASLVPLYEALLEAGRAHGLEPAGLGCRDTLRLESRLSLYGHEIDETTNPIEAGLGWTVKLDKPSFIGKSSLEAIRERGPERTIVGLEVLGKGIARQGYPIQDTAGRPIGCVTSGGPSPTLGKNIALGYVPLEFATVGSRLHVDCRGKSVESVVVPTPFYKRAPLG